MTRHKQLAVYNHQTLAGLEVFSQPEQLVEAFFTASTVGLGVFDEQLRYLTINETLARMNGIPAEAHVGKTLREVLGDACDVIEQQMKHVFATGEPICNFEIKIKLPTRAEIGHWIENYFPIKDNTGKVKQVGVIVVEVTDQRKLEESLHVLTGKLLRAQDEEQRRIARDLHDSVNQYHVAMKMNLLRLREAEPESSKERELLAECLDLVERCIAETRTISYLLHPPLLDEMGFASATRWYVKGFAQRSGIKVNLNVPPELERLPAAVEVALFRVLQEALTNVHRHAHAPMLDINIQLTHDEIALEVHDYGQGITSEKLRYLQEAIGSAGVGIASMHERIHELGGQLQIQSNHEGTIIRAEIPLPATRYQNCDTMRTAASASA